MRRRRMRGFTLVELIVAICIASIVLIFAVMFIAAPVGAFETESRRAGMTELVSASWPAIEQDLKTALPNSLRTRRNGSFVVVELLRVVDGSRYMSPPAATFTVAGAFRGVTVPFARNDHFLSVNNLGTPGADAYALSGSITAAGSSVQITAGALPGEQQLTVAPAPVFVADSPRHTLYLVSGPVTFLCDESAGTLRRYQGYAVAANQANWDSPAEFNVAGVSGSLLATGLTTCDFRASPLSASVPQTVSMALTATRGSGESITIFHVAGSQYLP